MNRNSENTAATATPKRTTILYQGREITVSPMGKKIYDELCSASYTLSALDLVFATLSSDPRREIYRLRSLGINIRDKWVSFPCKRFAPHKRYYLPTEEVSL